MTKLTISIPEQVAAAARSLAEAEATTLSALAARGLTDRVLAHAARAEATWLAGREAALPGYADLAEAERDAARQAAA